MLKDLQALGLPTTLATLYRDRNTVDCLLARAELPLERLPPFGNAQTSAQYWDGLLRQLDQGASRDGLSQLVGEALADYPANPVLLAARKLCAHGASASPTLLVLATDPHLNCSLDQHYQALVDINGLPRPIPALNAYLEDLAPTLARHRPTLLHFCGHTDQNLGTEFKTRTGEIKTVGPQAWHDLVRGLNGGETEPLQLVVFNSCGSDELARITASACGAAIGYEGPVNEDETIAFARSFYTSLVHGQSIASALALARAQLKAQGCAVAARALRLHTRGHRHGGELRPFAPRAVP